MSVKYPLCGNFAVQRIASSEISGTHILSVLMFPGLTKLILHGLGLF